MFRTTKSRLLHTSRNAALRTDYFRTEEVLNICISVQNQTDFLCHLIKRYLFQFKFPPFVCFYSMAEREGN